MLVSKCITRKPRIQRARAPASLSFHCLHDMCIPKTLNIIFKTTVKISTCQGWTCCIDMSGGPDGPVGWPAGHVKYKWIMGRQRVTDASVGFKTQSAPVYSFGFHYLQNISWTLTFCLAPTGWIPLPPSRKSGFSLAYRCINLKWPHGGRTSMYLFSTSRLTRASCGRAIGNHYLQHLPSPPPSDSEMTHKVSTIFVPLPLACTHTNGFCVSPTLLTFVTLFYAEKYHHA